MLLPAWGGGSRLRPPIVGLHQAEDLRRLEYTVWVLKRCTTKSDVGGVRSENQLRGPVVAALRTWLYEAKLNHGPSFRQLLRGGHVGAHAITSDEVAGIVKRRAALAESSGDWAAHSLRSGCVTEAGRQGVPLGDVMAMSEHRSVATVMGYFQAGALVTSRATHLLDERTAAATSLPSPLRGEAESES